MLKSFLITMLQIYSLLEKEDNRLHFFGNVKSLEYLCKHFLTIRMPYFLVIVISGNASG
jgi:hypothetical protein